MHKYLCNFSITELVMDSVLWQENGNTILITELLFQNMRKHQEVLYDKHLEILPKWLEAGRCIHYRSLGEGRHFCLGSDILQTILHSDSAGQVLLDVPVEALPRMMQQNISIYVLVIKYKHLEKEGKKTEEEQKIEKICQDYVCQYGK
ncbi:hypothetical protein LSH36_472g01009 [Paralvinella palmiformis]|uniref:Uncharacterized protein n=1 Tax=Paralvinella palmiformis TaxID=53620 RepID=A0AAD9MZR0_9ANNE|nr:hypothetical protein LSH36_472g01009 [Paralvinella palmiformis]